MRPTRLVSLMLVTIVPLTACTGAVPVRDVTADKFGYLAKAFPVSSISKEQASTITSKDKGTFPFQRITFSVTPRVEVSAQSAAQPPVYHSTWTFINAGGPFIQGLEEQTSNNLPLEQVYTLSYRNLFDLRNQAAKLNSETTGVIWETKSLTTFSPINDSSTGSLEYVFAWAPMVQLVNFKDRTLRCEAGRTYPANTINAKLEGEAQELTCDFSNANGVQSHHQVRAYLRHYGLVLVRSSQTTAHTTFFQIDDVHVE